MGRRFDSYTAHFKCPHRLARPRTPAFHAGNRGSNPLGDVNRAVSSAGRASALQAEGRRFDPCTAHFGGVVQLVRTLACHARGREFESRRPRFQKPPFRESFLNLIRNCSL